ncbi:hypothetical protein DID80_02630 [Candidatus Marinamargulisbacteria bacterium SCGC AAA071-K20]|nr:hypothetical protein DID80_02630 [Candidatus Marinamargulisbacteria bacterium SCGC AAA071-K20]
MHETLITDSKQVRQFIEARFNLSYTKSGSIALLHQLGFKQSCLQKTSPL